MYERERERERGRSMLYSKELLFSVFKKDSETANWFRTKSIEVDEGPLRDTVPLCRKNLLCYSVVKKQGNSDL